MSYFKKYSTSLLCLLSILSISISSKGKQKDVVGQFVCQRPISPLTNQWDANHSTLARFYPQALITEEQFLRTAKMQIGLLDDDSQISLISERSTPGGIHHRYSQTYKGIPVLGAELVISLSYDGFIVSVFSNILPISGFDVNTSLIAEEGFTAATAGIDLNNLRGDISHELLIAEIEDAPRLVFRWWIPANEPLGDWEILVDAVSGKEIYRRDLRQFSVTGHGRVFIPDPKTAIGSDNLFDNGDQNSAIPDECYSDTLLLEIDDAAGGFYYLTGAYVSTAPTANRAQETTPDFYYYRQDDRFEEVNTYYHIDTYQRYIQSLGFDNIINRPQEFDVNGTTEDNSWFSPMTGIITLGSGGVDDGEDADVIIHEYGHAIQWDILPGWSGGHSGAMGEGFGDYIAGAYSLALNPDFHPEWVFTWDGHNEFWPGRMLNMPYHYPENAGGEIHDAGQLWSAGLIDIWYEVPNVDTWNTIIFEHHYSLGNGATMEDAANAILMADININNGDYRQIIIDNFGERGFVDPTYLRPIILHDPLPDSEDTLAASFMVTAEIVSEQPLDSTSLLLYWGIEGEIIDQVPLEPAGSDTMMGLIPGPFNRQTVCYYLNAADIYGGLTASPPDAPGETHEFYVGPDTIPPVITVIDTLPNTVFCYGGGTVSAVIDDNLGLCSVQVWSHKEGEEPLPGEMYNTDGDTFAADISWEELQSGESFYYCFNAVDSSVAANSTQSMEYSFAKVSSCLFDGFDSGMGNWASDTWDTQYFHYHSSPFAAHDRDGIEEPIPTELVMILTDPWNTNSLNMLTLEYWSRYYMVPSGDTGWVEIKTNSGDWQAVDYVSGVMNSWVKRTISLDDYLGIDTLTVRFRSVIDTANFSVTYGWFVDDMSLITEPIVQVIGDDDNLKPGKIALYPVSPNPFNNSTIIPFTLDRELPVKIRVYNQLGQAVATVIDRKMKPGEYKIRWETGGLSSGVYFVGFSADNFQQVAKIIILK